MAEPVAHFGNLTGGSARKLLKSKMDIGVLRPWLDPRTGYSYVTLKVRDRDGQFVMNSHTKRVAEINVKVENEATLFRDEWKYIDTRIQRILRQPLTAWDDLRRANTVRIPNGMGTPVIQWQSITDAGTADISMDALRRSQRDRPHTDIGYLPLPIIHGDFSFTLREIEVSRQGGAPLDSFMSSQVMRKCLEKIEGLTAGTEPSYTYGGGTIYGYTNHPLRTTYSLVAPGVGGWTPDDTLNDLIAMRQLMIANLMTGPYVVYVSPAWSQWLEVDYSQAKGTNSLRQRVLAMDGINSIRTLWSLTGNQMIMTQLDNPDNSRAIVGMNPRTVEWEVDGGLELHYKVMMIWVPHFRASLNGFLPIIVAS